MFKNLKKDLASTSNDTPNFMPPFISDNDRRDDDQQSSVSSTNLDPATKEVLQRYRKKWTVQHRGRMQALEDSHKTKLREINDENAQLKEKVSELQARLVQALSQNQANGEQRGEEDVPELFAQLNEKDARIQDLTSQLETSENVRKRLTNEVDLLGGSIRDLQNELEEVKERLTADTKEADAARANESSETEKMVERLKVNLEELSKENSDLIMRNAEIKHAYELELSHVQNRNSDLQAKVDNLLVDDNNLVIEAKQKKIKQQAYKIRDLEKQLHRAASNNGDRNDEEEGSDSTEDALPTGSLNAMMFPGRQMRSVAVQTHPASGFGSGEVAAARSSPRDTSAMLATHQQYIKHVVLKFVLSRESDALTILKPLASACQFTPEEVELVKQTLSYRSTVSTSWLPTSWTRSTPNPKCTGQYAKALAPTSYS